jgi:hypothetical protein
MMARITSVGLIGSGAHQAKLVDFGYSIAKPRPVRNP